MEEKKSFLFVTCDEAKQICDKTQYGEASIWERVKLNIRLSWCKVTRAYTRNNRKLTAMVEKAKLETVQDQRKQDMKKKLQEEMAK